MKKLLILITASLLCMMPANSQQIWSGTGFAIGNRYVVTNHHVVEDADNIYVRVKNKQYYAEVVATDEVNDIAIIQMSDSDFKGFSAIPYGVTTRLADVGEDIFVLGYPLSDYLGDEVKLTTGVINSRTGMIGWESCYQIQAPVTNGNSGGPMFDNKGNVIGIVVGGLKKSLNLAENVGYAIKTKYLKDLIENAGLNIPFPNNNVITNLSRPEKVKRISNFVVYIECSNDYVDLGLPSGTLWKNQNEDGYYTYDEAINLFKNNLPTKKQWDEFYYECEWKLENNGLYVIGPNGKSIFFQANGSQYDTKISGMGKIGNYWSCTYYNNLYAFAMYFDHENIYVDGANRNFGFSVRLVKQ